MTVNHLSAIDSLLQSRDIKKAEILITRHLRGKISTKERADLLTRRAQVRLRTGRIDEALEDLKETDIMGIGWLEQPQSLEIIGDCHLARFEMASVGFADRTDTEYALAAYEHIIKAYPHYQNLGWVLYQKGRVLLTGNHIEAASACFQKALLAPSHLQLLTAYCYERLGFVAFYEMRDPHTAFTFLDKAVHTYPANETRTWLVQVHTLRSRVLRDMHRYEKAVEAAELAIQIANVANEGKVGLGDALLTASEVLSSIGGRERDIVLYLQQFTQVSRKPLGIDVTWSRAYEMLGDAYLNLEHFQSAVNAYQSALQFNPYHPWEQTLYYRAARSYYHLGEYEKSIAALEKMINSVEADGQKISDYRVFQVLGNARYALSQYAQAVSAYQAALEIAPSSAETDSIEHYLALSLQLSTVA